jgi:predicted Rdx family selenoprotein
VAVGLAAAIERAHGTRVQTTMKPGGGGVFDVVVGGVLVFSKWTQGRFPLDWEILDAVEEALGKA